ncbi:hypothetical protein HP439_18395 [Sphingobacterium shayense]|uniref:hypothetical protein n=1 Tax=Sphingobacterium shayense TaxID=626343 RepID=UPI001557DC07|nr:hypothetical protein [Sphingobacterium shayense]NQD72697.1 hypothetical protein [Sphingobacterium shayense]
MKKTIILIAILIFTGATIIIGFLGTINISYELQDAELRERYKLPYNLNFDYWGYDVSQENYGLVIVDSVGGLVLYSGDLIQSDLSINGLLECFITSSSVVFKTAMSDGNVAYISIDIKHRRRLISEDEYLNIKTEYIKPILLDQKLINWLKFKNESHMNIFVLMFLLCFLFGLSCFFWYRFIKSIKHLF